MIVSHPNEFLSCSLEYGNPAMARTATIHLVVAAQKNSCRCSAIHPMPNPADFSVLSGMSTLEKVPICLTPKFSCQHTITIAAKPHPKSACLLQRSLGGESR